MIVERERMNVTVIHLIQIWGEKSFFMYSEETGNRSAPGPIVPKVKHSHPDGPVHS